MKILDVGKKTPKENLNVKHNGSEKSGVYS